MSQGIVPKDGQLHLTMAADNDLLTNVILSLEIYQGDFFLDPTFGLRRRDRLKNTEASARLVAGDIRAALQWLLDIGRAISVEVETERDLSRDVTRLKAIITVVDRQGNPVSYEKFVEVV